MAEAELLADLDADALVEAEALAEAESDWLTDADPDAAAESLVDSEPPGVPDAPDCEVPDCEVPDSEPPPDWEAPDSEPPADSDVAEGGVDEDDSLLAPDCFAESVVDSFAADSLVLWHVDSVVDSVAESLAGPVLPGLRTVLPSVASVFRFAALTS